MTLVGVAGIAVKESLHNFGHRMGRHLHKNVEVIGHQHICIESEVVSALRFLQQHAEPTVIILIPENRLFLIASTDDMINGSGKMNARPPSHEHLLTRTWIKSKFQKPDTLASDTLALVYSRAGLNKDLYRQIRMASYLIKRMGR